jgi:hypothetical protein
MSSVYTPTPVKLVSTTLPSDGDGPGIKAADVNPSFEGLADGVAYAQQITDALADLTALAAIATPANGLARHVVAFGWYVFETAAAAGISPWRVAAADATPGNWVSSTAHETTKTRIVQGTRICGISANAGVKAGANPAVLWTSYVPITAADVALSFGAAFLASGLLGGATLQWGYIVPIDEYLVDGATLSTVTAYLQGGGSHVALPARMPKIAIVRANLLQVGTALITDVALKSTAAGYTTDTTATAAAFDNVHTIVQATDQNNVIDRSLYAYYAIFLDEDGANATGGTYFQAFALSFTAIPDARRS